MAGEQLGVVVIGSDGRMGQQVVAAVEEATDLFVAGKVEIGDDLGGTLDQVRPHVAVDFTTPRVVEKNLRILIERGVHPVIGTTGLPKQTLEEFQALTRERGLGGLVAPNFALGAVLMMELSRQASRFLQSVEITEYHHPAKLDAPSGTSILTRDRILEQLPPGAEVPIHSVRLPGYLAHQEVLLGGAGERLTIRHDSIDRACFMPGVLLACRRVGSLKELVLGLENLMEF